VAALPLGLGATQASACARARRTHTLVNPFASESEGINPLKAG